MKLLQLVENVDDLFSLELIDEESCDEYGSKNNETKKAEVKEEPESKFYDKGKQEERSISIPKGTEIQASTYNDAIKALQNSFKESSEILENLLNVKVVEDNQINATKDMEMVEAANNAILNVFENGPYFERVDRSDKSDIKDIVSYIRKDIKSVLKSTDVTFYQPSLWASALVNGLTIAVTGALKGAVNSTILDSIPMVKGIVKGAYGIVDGMQKGSIDNIKQLIATRLWQIVGIVFSEEGQIHDLCKTLTQNYSKELGEYKIIYAKTTESIVDLFRLHFHIKDNRTCYFILVDKKLPSDLKDAENEIIDITSGIVANKTSIKTELEKKEKEELKNAAVAIKSDSKDEKKESKASKITEKLDNIVKKKDDKKEKNAAEVVKEYTEMNSNLSSISKNLNILKEENSTLNTEATDQILTAIDQVSGLISERVDNICSSGSYIFESIDDQLQNSYDEIFNYVEKLIG